MTRTDAHVQIKYEELPTFSEIMAAGTAASILPVRSITRKSTSEKFAFQTGGDQPGPRSMQLAGALKDIQKGRVEDEFGWCMRVQAAESDSKIRGMMTREDIEADMIRSSYMMQEFRTIWSWTFQPLVRSAWWMIGAK